MPHLWKTAILAGCALVAVPAAAQEESSQEAPRGGPPAGFDLSDSVFDGDWASLGVGVAIGPSYTGSDDYVFNVLPFVQGSLGGIDIRPRAAGVTLDFLPDGERGEISFDAGLAVRLRSDRAQQIEDEVVEQFGELDRAVEVGPSVGIKFPQIISPVDSLTIGTDVMWDVAGGHNGMVVAPSVTYFTPLSFATVASLSISAEWADSDFQEYYFDVDPANYTGEGVSPLPAFQSDGGGFTSAGVNLLVGHDLSGNATDGGFGLVAIASYSRVLGNAADTPFTSIRGTRDQFLGVIGIAYTF